MMKKNSNFKCDGLCVNIPLEKRSKPNQPMKKKKKYLCCCCWCCCCWEKLVYFVFFLKRSHRVYLAGFFLFWNSATDNLQSDWITRENSFIRSSSYPIGSYHRERERVTAREKIAQECRVYFAWVPPEIRHSIEAYWFQQGLVIRLDIHPEWKSFFLLVAW